MFIKTEADLGYHSFNYNKLLYDVIKNPHIIFDTDFEVCLLFINNSSDLIPSFIDEFILLYKNKEEDVLANLIKLLIWIKSEDNQNQYDQMIEIIKNKYPQYIKDIEKFMILL